jgi:hypothetical protein
MELLPQRFEQSRTRLDRETPLLSIHQDGYWKTRRVLFKGRRHGLTRASDGDAAGK